MLGSRYITIISTVCSTTVFIAVALLLPLMAWHIQVQNSMLLGTIDECQSESRTVWRQLLHYEASVIQNKAAEFDENRIRDKRGYAPSSSFRAARPAFGGVSCCSCQQGKEGSSGPQGRPGKDGQPGGPGPSGRNGREGRYIIPVTASEPPCQKCPTAPVGSPGLPGAKGNRGMPGKNYIN
uniref:Nematode cuticle collagen N-terminal domain-containing protein n=1 Tax=Panagrolaimus superbus TaxID=310955 RepID=A0A914YGZ0_9BILA